MGGQSVVSVELECLEAGDGQQELAGRGLADRQRGGAICRTSDWPEAPPGCPRPSNAASGGISRERDKDHACRKPCSAGGGIYSRLQPLGIRRKVIRRLSMAHAQQILPSSATRSKKLPSNSLEAFQVSQGYDSCLTITTGNQYTQHIMLHTA